MPRKRTERDAQRSREITEQYQRRSKLRQHEQGMPKWWRGLRGCESYGAGEVRVIYSRFNSECPYNDPPTPKGEYAKLLRQGAPQCERILHREMKCFEKHGYSFYHQAVIDPYIVDFLCPAKRLIIELDGICHKDRSLHDSVRDRKLRELGYRVIHFHSSSVHTNVEGVLAQIASALGLVGAKQ